MSQLQKLRNDVKKQSDPKKGKFLQRFFKTDEGEYGFGDIFAGLTVPQSRIIAKKHKDLKLSEIEELLKSKIHEERLIALFILVDQFKKGNSDLKKEIFDFYLARTKHINNWDLVDSSADKIVGQYLLNRNDKLTTFDQLAISKNIWERRIAIIATYQFIKSGRFEETLKIAEILLYDKEDLIHKAVGWMLREGGKRNSMEEEEKFLKKHYKSMPRTMLRYAIEKFPEDKRKMYLKGTV